MKQIVINEDSLSLEELDFSVIRVKGLIINSKNEILLAHNNGTYQFPGGHLEENENMDDCLKREVLEETGIEIKGDVGPFFQINTFDSNYFNTGKKVSNKIYYFVIRTDDVPDYSKTHYDELECQSEFNLFYVNVNKLEEFFNNAMDDGSLDKNIGKEMLLVLDEYIKIYGNNK